MKKTLLALSFATLASSMSFGDEAAQAGFYIGGSYAFLDTEVFGEDLDLGALVFNGGYSFNEYIAVEGRIGTGVVDDDFFGIDVELNYLAGVYAKVGIPTGTIVYPYVVLGLTQVELEISGFGQSETDDDNDISYGIGANFEVSNNVGIYVEYMSWYDEDDIEITGFNLGANYKF